MKVNRLQPNETDILKQISDWLSWSHIPHWRINSGAYVGEHKNKHGIVKKRFVQFVRILFPKYRGLKFPDLQLIYKGETVYIEIKRPGTHKDDPGQDDFLRLIIENNGYAAKIQTLDEMQSIIEDIKKNHSRPNQYYEFNGYGLIGE